jgi:hypothetical protein
MRHTGRLPRTKPAKVPTHKKLDVINAKSSERVVLMPAQSLGRYRFVVQDCQGRTVRKGQVALGKRAIDFGVLASGLLSLERIAR